MSEHLVKIPKLHPAQQQIFDEAKRFNVLKCGRRFGKTSIIEELSTIALDGKKVGIWSPTYKDLHEVWKGLLRTYQDVIESKNEQVKQIVLITGGIIDMWSMEDPDSGRGRKYHRAIVDEAEKARHLKQAWEQTIRATLVDYEGDAWIMSTPKFGQTYFKTILFINSTKYSNWKSWKFTSYDNPHLPIAEVDMAKSQLDDLTFRCEFLAEDVDISMRPFAYAYSDIIHKGKRSFDPNLELMLSFDFNKDPITCVASQHGEAPAEDRHKPEIDMELRYIKQFKLANSDIYALCEAIKTAYDVYNPLYLITGDATGRARSALVRGNINYWKVIKSEMGVSDNQIKTPSVNPSVKDTRVLMNSMFQNYNIVVDEENCPDLIQDFKYVECDEFGDLLKDRTGEYKKADLLDCARYNQATFFKWFLKNNPKNPPNEEIISEDY